jgi:tetratricopeptide (TPR) repeat protein
VIKGTVLIGQGNAKGALDAFTAAVKLAPDLAPAYRGQGQAFQALGQVDRAIDSYERALKLNDRDPGTLNNLAWIYAEERKAPDKALPLAAKANQLAPGVPEIMDTLGWVQYRKGAYNDAQKTLAQAVEKASSNAKIHYHLGMTYEKLGRRSDAVSSLRRAAQLDAALAKTEGIEARIKELGG